MTAVFRSTSLMLDWKKEKKNSAVFFKPNWENDECKMDLEGGMLNSCLPVFANERCLFPLCCSVTD